MATNEDMIRWRLAWKIGKVAYPIIEKSIMRFLKTKCAVLCTSDGYNICALEIEEGEVRKIASLTSSLFSISNAVLNIIKSNNMALNQTTGTKAEVLLSLNNMMIAVTEVKHPILKNLILLVAAKDESHGLLLATERQILNSLEEAFQDMDLTIDDNFAAVLHYANHQNLTANPAAGEVIQNTQPMTEANMQIYYQENNKEL